MKATQRNSNDWVITWLQGSYHQARFVTPVSTVCRLAANADVVHCVRNQIS